MNSSNLKLLLTEYARKRESAISEASARKSALYLSNPRLQKIDDDITKHSIALAKLLLSSDNLNKINNINKKITALKQEKSQILEQLNISASYFEPSFNCNLCKDTGYISQGYHTKRCKCLNQKLFDLEYNKYNVYNMQNDTFDKFKLDYYSDKVNLEKYNSHISPRENMKQILDICNRFVKNFDDIKEKNLLFTGNSGLGKTFLSNCIANELLNSGKTVLYQTSSVMLDTIIKYRLRKI